MRVGRCGWAFAVDIIGSAWLGEVLFMCSMKNFRLALVLVASRAAFAGSAAQQSTPATGGLANSAPPPPFAQVVNQYFSQWDSNGDGKLTPDEINAAVANPKFHDEAAAAIAAIRMVVHDGGKYTLPPITQVYLVSSPLREASTSDEQIDLQDDPSKPDKFDHPPAFEPRYRRALKRLRPASRDLFPQSLPSLDAIHQQGLGDCPFVSTVGAMVHRNPSAVKAMFTQNDDGSTTVAFGDGSRVKVARVTDADIVICSTAGTNGLWLTILEKAYRKNHLKTLHPIRRDRPDIYDRMASAGVIEMLDGHQIRRVDLRSRRGDPRFPITMRQDLNAALREHRLVKAVTSHSAKKSIPGIVPAHAYAILGYNDDTGLVHVWNPHSNNFTPKGPDGLQYGYTTKAGQFDIPLRDLLQIYDGVNFETQTPNRH